MSSLTKGVLEEETCKLLDDYLTNFNNGDFVAAASIWHEPTLGVSAAAVSLVPSRKDLENYLQTTVAKLREDGFDHAEWVGPKKVIVLDEKGVVLVCCNLSRLRKNGTSIEEFTVTYSLRRDNDHGWQIAAFHQHATGVPLQ